MKKMAVQKVTVENIAQPKNLPPIQRRSDGGVPPHKPPMQRRHARNAGKKP